MAEPRTVHWRDLAALTPLQRAAELSLPLPWLILALGFAQLGWLAASAVATALFFTAGLRVTHDCYHRNLGLSQNAGDRLLFVLSLLLGGALHAIEHTHLHHHRHCLADDDLEGRISRLGLFAAVLRSPLYPLQIHWHTWHHGTPRQQRWMRRELAGIAVVQLLVWSSGSAALQWVCAWLLFANAAVPLVGIWSVHRGCAHGESRARTSRSALFNGLSFNMLYHHEHHQYPGVPARHLPELARRMDADSRERHGLPLLQPRRGVQRGLCLGLFALLPLLGGCGHSLSGAMELDVCDLAMPAVRSLIAEPVSLAGRTQPPLAGSCQFRAVDDAQKAPQIEVQVFTDAAAARTRSPLPQTLRLILAEAGNAYGGADILAFEKVAETNVAYGDPQQPGMLVLAERGVILQVNLRGVYRQSAIELAETLWKAMEHYRPKKQTMD